MICPWCETINLPGAEECSYCWLDLMHHDRPMPQDRVERSLMEDPVRVLLPRKPVVLPPVATIGEAIGVLQQCNIGAVLVVDGGKLVGILSERDVLVKVTGLCPDYANRPVSEVMTRQPETIRLRDSLAYALHKMDCGGYRHLPVVEEGHVLGVISVRDLLEHVTNLCASITGR